MLKAMAARVHTSEARVRQWMTAGPDHRTRRRRLRGGGADHARSRVPPPARRRRTAAWAGSSACGASSRRRRPPPAQPSLSRRRSYRAAPPRPPGRRHLHARRRVRAAIATYRLPLLLVVASGGPRQPARLRVLRAADPALGERYGAGATVRRSGHHGARLSGRHLLRAGGRETSAAPSPPSSGGAWRAARRGSSRTSSAMIATLVVTSAYSSMDEYRSPGRAGHRRGYQIERSSSATSVGRRGPRFAFAPGRATTRLGDVGQLVLRDAEVAEALEAAEPRELLDARGRVVRAERRAEATDGLRHRACVEPERCGQADGVHRALRQPVAAAERLGERVPEAEPESAERRAGVHRAFEESRRGRVRRGLVDHERQRVADRRRARVRVASSRALRSRVYSASAQCASAFMRRPDRLLERQVERELRLVDRADGHRARVAPPPPFRRPEQHAEEGRPLRARVRRRHRDDRGSPPATPRELGDDRLARVDRAAAAEPDEPVALRARCGATPPRAPSRPGRAAGRRRRRRRRGVADGGRAAARRDEQRPLDADLAADLGELGERARPEAVIRTGGRSRSPRVRGPARARADDATRSRANSTNASRRASGARGAARERDLARRVDPLDPRLGERARRELRLDRRARDERDAVAGLHRAAHRLLQPELEPDVEVAQPHAEPAQLVLDDPGGRPRPPASRSASRRAARRAAIVRPANRWPGGQTRTTSSYENGSNCTPRWRRDAPTIPSSSSRSATSSTTVCVSCTSSATRTPGCSRWNSHEEQRHDDRRRARRGAERQLAGELALGLRRRRRRASAPRARAAAARRDTAASRPRSARRAGPSGRAAACRAASRAPAPGARRRAG